MVGASVTERTRGCFSDCLLWQETLSPWNNLGKRSPLETKTEVTTSVLDWKMGAPSRIFVCLPLNL